MFSAARETVKEVRNYKCVHVCRGAGLRRGAFIWPTIRVTALVLLAPVIERLLKADVLDRIGS
jgi:hypothetical protein